MSACEQELCPFWSGNGGCDCGVFGISEDERRKQQRSLGIRTPEQDAWDECEQCEHDRDEHAADGCAAAVLTSAGVTTCSCGGFVEAA